MSPEQISARLKIDFPEDESLRISHEAIYQSLYVESRGGLKRELVACLRTGRALRVPRARSRKELAAHAQLTVETGLPVYFADPHAPWQRATNENTNGLLRQYFPKGTDLSRWSADELTAIAAVLNSRPRKTLEWKTPAEALDDHLRSMHASVATTG